MITVTDEQFAEYTKLKRLAKKQKIWKSAKSVENLEDDIDIPIKLCVAMFALLGCEPAFSCCGFDYPGQYLHKSHQYGCAYFKFKPNPTSEDLLKRIVYHKEMNNQWKAYHENENAMFPGLVLQLYKPRHWWSDDINIIHHPENCIIYIKLLEEFLTQLHPYFFEEVILEDTNKSFLERFPDWQYPPKNDWIIHKSDIMKELNIR